MDKTEKRIFKIAVTGGPCAGKTTAMSRIREEFDKKPNYAVLFVPETATELISGGISTETCSSRTAYQKFLLKLQIEKEKIFEEAAKLMKQERVVIICDRGLMDNKAYMDSQDFYELLDDVSLNEVELRDSYDAVFHLLTAAKGAEEFYNTTNNSARTETPEEAIEADDKLISAWTGHSHFRIIDNSTDFEEKKKRLISEIFQFLGEPEPYEIERKYLIEYPNLDFLNSLDNCHCVDIIQTYLNSNDNEEVRVRQRGENGHYIYVQTTKRTISSDKRIEVERRLSENEYLALLLNADTSKRPIIKKRYCLTYNNKYFEIDIYPFWKDKAIAEIELSDENAKITKMDFPDFIKVIMEVTDDELYKNASLADLKNPLVK